MGVGEGALQVCSGLAFRIVHKYEAIFLIETQLVGPAPGVIRATVVTPRGRGSAGGCPGPVAGAARLAGSIFGILADTGLFRFRITALFILCLLPWVKHRENERSQTRQFTLVSGFFFFSLVDGRHSDSQDFTARFHTVDHI